MILKDFIMWFLNKNRCNIYSCEFVLKAYDILKSHPDIDKKEYLGLLFKSKICGPVEKLMQENKKDFLKDGSVTKRLEKKRVYTLSINMLNRKKRLNPVWIPIYRLHPTEYGVATKTKKCKKKKRFKKIYFIINQTFRSAINVCVLKCNYCKNKKKIK